MTLSGQSLYFKSLDWKEMLHKAKIAAELK